MRRHNLIILALGFCLLMGFSNAGADYQAKVRNFPTEIAPPLEQNSEEAVNEVAPVFNLTTQPGIEPIPSEGINWETTPGSGHVSPLPKTGPFFPIEIRCWIMMTRLGW